MGLLETLQTLITPSTLLLMALGVASGMMVGAIPGLSATMGMALITPLTFTMDSATAISLLLAVYVGAISGGLYSATLLRIPGTSSSIATTFDGFPLARQGKAGMAIGIGLVASFIGGTVSFIFLSTLSPLLAKFALKFGPAEYFAVSLLGLSTIAAVVKESTVKGLLACMFGLLASTVGLDRVVGVQRFTFGWLQLNSGFDVLAILIGLFAIPQILVDITNTDNDKEQMAYDKLSVPWKKFKSSIGNFLRSSIIGTWIGLLPGAGGSIASLLSYSQAKTASKEPETFGKGNINGLIASEAANNAVVGGSIIPLLTLGIPGDTPAAVLLAALTIHGLQPGPLLYKTNPEVINTFLASLYISNILMIIIGFIGAKYIIKSLKAPKNILYPLVVVMCLVGTFAVNQRLFDVGVMIVFGLIGVLMEKYGYPVGPAVLGIILGPIIEVNLRKAIQVSNTGVLGIVTRPLTAVILLFTLFSFLWPLIRNRIKKIKGNKNNEEINTSNTNYDDETNKYKKFMIKANRISGIVFLAVSIFIFKYSETIAQTSIEAVAYGPSFYPKLLAVIFAVLSILLIIFPNQNENKSNISIGNTNKFLIGVILLVVYTLLIPITGFVVTSAIYLLISFLYIGVLNRKKIPQYVIIACTVPLGIYFLFEKALYVFLPHGFLF